MLLALVGGLAVVGIGSFALLNRNDRSEPAVAAARTSSTLPTSTSSPATTASTVPGISYVATARVSNISVFDDPTSKTPSKNFDSPWFVNGDPNAAVPLVFLVEEQRADGWLKVLMPIRPNGSTGWIRSGDVTIVTTPYRITVELSARRLRVYDGSNVILEETVAVGKDATPTPLGHYFIRALLKAPNPNTVYGPYAYGLSGYSEVLETFNGGDAEVGIHGNNDASVLGSAVTSGCIRMSNTGITRLSKLLPLGVPVDILA